MIEKNIPLYYWAEAVNTANYILNRCITSGVHEVTPEECFYGRKPSLEHLKVFGCLAYVHVPTEVRSKLDPKVEKCVLVGYSEEQKGYKCYNPVTKKNVVSRDVIFDELGSWYNPKQNLKTDEDNEIEDRDKSKNVRDCHRDGNNVGQQSSTLIECSGPSKNSGSKSDSNAWSGKSVGHKKYEEKKGKQKMPEYEMLAHGSKNMEDADSDTSLDDELGIRVLKIPGMEKAWKDVSKKLRRSDREKKTVERFGYDTYMAMHYAYMSKVVQIPDPNCFEEAKVEKKWVNAMEEVMHWLKIKHGI